MIRRSSYLVAALWLGLIGCTTLGQESPLFEKRTVLAPEGKAACVGLPMITVTKNNVVIVIGSERMGNRHDLGNVQNSLISRSVDRGKTWSKPVRMRGTPKGVVSDLVTGRTFLFIGQNQALTNKDGKRIRERWLIKNPPEVYKNINQFVSDDDGKNWQKVQDLAPLLQKKKHTHLPLPSISTGFQLKFGLHKGRLILPTRIWTKNKWDFNYSHNTIIYSDDHGKTWSQGGLSQKACGESCGVELADGRVYLSNRNEVRRVGGIKGRGFNMRNHCISSDGGQTFTVFADDPVLIESQCQAGMVRVSDPSDGNLICFSNPATTKGRHHLTVRASVDNCKTWPIAKLIDKGKAGYSSMASGRNGMIYIAYERGEKHYRTETAVARFNTAWLLKAEQNTALDADKPRK